MAVNAKDTEKLRKIVALLPKKHCGKCGYDNCGAYAVALVEGKVPPVGCKKSLDKIDEICAVLGVPVPENAAELAREHKKKHGGGPFGPHHKGHHHGPFGRHHGGGGHHHG